MGWLRFFLLILFVSLSATAAKIEDISNGRHSLKKLGPQFYVNVPIKPVEGARLVLFNHELAQQLGLELPEDPAELEKLILKNFAFMVDTYGKDGKSWMATYYQDSESKQIGSARGDGRALWSGELQNEKGAHIDVVVKGIGQTPLAWTNHSDEAHRDGIQLMREAVHSFIMSEANSRNQINTTMDLAVIEIPITKFDKLTGKQERAAITIRVGEQTRLAHLRFWANRPIEFDKILRYVMNRSALTRGDHPGKPQDYLNALAKALADEAARYYDLHAVHASPTLGNRTTSGATIDLGTFRYLDAHHSNHSYLHNRFFLGGEYGQTEQIRDYLSEIFEFLALNEIAVSLERAHDIFDKEFQKRLTYHWLLRLGLEPADTKSLSENTRIEVFNLFKRIHEAENKADAESSKSAKYEPRIIFGGAFRTLLEPKDQQSAFLSSLFLSKRPWGARAAKPAGKIEKFLSWVMGPRPAEDLHLQLRLHHLLQQIQQEIPNFEARLSVFIENSRLVNDRRRFNYGFEFENTQERKLNDEIRDGKTSFTELSRKALASAGLLVDEGLRKNNLTILPRKGGRPGNHCGAAYGF